MPKVSVIIPTYQSVQFVQKTIESVLAQTYRDYEVIVVDGGSTDGTREVLNSYGSRIQVITQNGKGISNARNVGVLASKGEYVAFVDSDDLWLPDKLQFQVKFLDKKPSIVGMIYSDAFLFPEKGIYKFSPLANKRAFQIGKPHRGKVLRQLFMENFIPASTVMVRKLCFKRVGLFDESLMVCEDIDMWMRIAECFEVDYQDVVLAKIRLHEGSLTKNRERHLLSKIALRDKTVRRMPYLLKGFDLKTIDRIYYKMYLLLGIEYLLKHDLENAKKEFREYKKLYPYNLSAYFLLLLTLFPFSLIGRLELNRYIPRSLARRVYKKLST